MDNCSDVRHDSNRLTSTDMATRKTPARPKVGAGRHVALLRGINVGGRNRLPMNELARIFEQAGCRDVQTYIQSGNVVFSIAPSKAKSVARRIERAIEDEFDIRTPVITRSAAELVSVIDQLPFAGAGDDPKHLHVAFLSAAAAGRSRAALDQKRAANELVHIGGRELYLHLPAGVARTKLTNVFIDRSLGVTSTLRNWRTVTKLAALASGR